MIPTLIVTRPEPQGRAFADQLRGMWEGDLRLIQSPLLQIVPCQIMMPDVTGLIFTSVNGVAQADMLGLDKTLPAFCVGRKTADAAAATGFDPVIGPGTAHGLAQLIIALRPTGPLAHVRGRHARGDIAHTLTVAGVVCHDLIAYDQRVLGLSSDAKTALSGKNPVILPLFSPRTSAILEEIAPFAAPLHIVAISDAALPKLHGVTSAVATRPDGDAMLDATIACLLALRESGDA